MTIKERVTNAGRDMGEVQLLLLVGESVTCIVIIEISMKISQKVKSRCAIQVMSMTPEYIPKGLYVSYYRVICTSMFIDSLFTKARKWKQPGFPSADEWIMKM